MKIYNCGGKYPDKMDFKSGLVVPAGANLKIGGFISSFSEAQGCTVTGFEIPVD